MRKANGCAKTFCLFRSIRILSSSPTPEEILAFRPSEATQERIRALLAANKAGILSAEETIELEEFDKVERFLGKNIHIGIFDMYVFVKNLQKFQHLDISCYWY